MPFSGAKLQRIMSERCYSANRLCNETGIAIQVFLKHRNGVTSPSIDHVDRYALALHCTPNDLWDMPDPRDAVATIRNPRYRAGTLRNAKEKALLRILEFADQSAIDADAPKMIESKPPEPEEPEQDVIDADQSRPRLPD